MDPAHAVLRDVGCVVDGARIDFPMAEAWQAWLTLRSFQFAGGQLALYDDPAKRARLKAEALWEIERGRALSGMAVWHAAKTRSAFYQAMRRLFEQFDFVLMPATQVAPFALDWDWPREVGGQTMDTYHRWMACTVPATLAGLPALAMPAGLDAAGLPCSVQLIGPTQADWAVLQLGHAYDEASGLQAVQSPCLAA